MTDRTVSFVLDVSMTLNHGEPDGPTANIRMLVGITVDTEDEMDVDEIVRMATETAKDKLRPFLNNSTHLGEVPFMLVEINAG